MRSTFCIPIFLLVIFLTSPARAAPRLAVFGLGNYAQMIERQDSGSAAQPQGASLGYGAGLGGEFRFGKLLGLQVDVIYTQKNHLRSGSVLEATGIEVPASLRLFISEGRLTLGAGGYYSTFSAPGAALKDKDYGWSLVGGISLPLGPKYAFMVDGRLNIGLARLDTFGQQRTLNSIQILAGLKLGSP